MIIFLRILEVAFFLFGVKCAFDLARGMEKRYKDFINEHKQNK